MDKLPMAYDDEGRPPWTYDEHGHPQGPGFVQDDYTRGEALASVGLGWAKLVGALWDFCKAIDPPIEVNQVKEKFGGLRFYVGGVSEDTWDMVCTLIGAVERQSEHVCETCGEQGYMRIRGGWYFTACDSHSGTSKKVGEDYEHK